MCGLFGVRCPAGPRGEDPDHGPSGGPRHGLRGGLAEAVLRLGQLAEERGFDAAGLAWRSRSDTPAGRPYWEGVRRTGPFSLLADVVDSRAVEDAAAVIGHTRWATQGGLTAAQAGPNWVGQTIGSHNGDIAVTSLPGGASAAGDCTDSQVFFAAVDHCDLSTPAGREDLLAVCTRMSGRAAAVWAATDQDGLWLLRAGLSPLAVGYDSAGRLWWASNPAWLNRLDDELGIGLHRVRMLEEGTLWQTVERHRPGTPQHPGVRRAGVCSAGTHAGRAAAGGDVRADRAAR